MQNALASLHATFAALWLGCVLTEALFERTLMANGREGQLTLANLHVRVDKFVELPAIFGVVVTGLLMVKQSSRQGLAYEAMLVAGSVAIAANLYCVWLVFKRRDAASSGNWQRFESLDHVQHRVGAVVLVAVLTALLAGYWSRSVA